MEAIELLGGSASEGKEIAVVRSRLEGVDWLEASTAYAYTILELLPFFKQQELPDRASRFHHYFFVCE